MTSLLLFQNTFILRKFRVPNFADIIKIATMFIKTNFKDSKKGQKKYKLCTKLQSISIFVDVAKVANFR